MAKKKLTSAKAKEMLKNPPHGKPLTERQRKFFGAVASGKEPYEKAQLGNLLQPITMDDVSNFFDLFSVPQKALTKLITGKYQSPSEAMGIKNKVGAFATDMVLDPINVLGAGIVGKSAKAAKAPKVAEKVASKINSQKAEKLKSLIEPYREPAAPKRNYGNMVSDQIEAEAQLASSPKTFADKWKKYTRKDRDLLNWYDEQVNLFKRNPDEVDPDRTIRDFVSDPSTRFYMSTGFDIRNPSQQANYIARNLTGNFSDAYINQNLTQGGRSLLGERAEGIFRKPGDNFGKFENVQPWEIFDKDFFIRKNEQGGSIESRMGGLTDKGFNYNGAWGGQFQMGGNVLPGAIGNMYARTGAPSEGKYAKKTMPSAAEGYDVLPDPTDPERKYKLSAVVASAKDILNPLLRKKNPKAYDEWEKGRVEAIRKGVPAVEEYYQKNPLQQFLTPSEVKSALSQQRKGLYEDYVGALKDLREYEEISPFQRASLVGQMEEEQPIESLNYGWRFATQPVNISRIVENKPEESFSYSYNPKTGEYKKLPSMAGGGKMMSYYQAGLDFQPKTISRDGSEIPYAQKGMAVSDNTRTNIPVRQYVNRETVKSPSNNDWVNNALYAADVVTDLMQLGNFVPHPIGQAMGKAGNVAGVWVDGIQAGRDVYRGDLGSAAVNAVSAKLPSIIKNPAIMGGYRRSAKYSFGNRSFYTPVDKRYGKMTKKELMGNRALLGALGAETVYDSKKKGGKIKKDNAGYWNPENWGKPVEIDSNIITMDGVYEPLLGVSNTGDTQMMYPGEDYVFDGESVTEYPMARNGVGVNQADEFPLEKLDNLTNFTNYNNMAKAKKGKKLPKAQSGLGILANPLAMKNLGKAVRKVSGPKNMFPSIAMGIGNVVGGIQQLKEEKEMMQGAKQSLALSDVTKQAAGLKPERVRREYERPEKNLLSSDQMAFPSYGTGYDVLGMAEDGMQIGGNLTEIQNTYAPNTLYDNLGYEPLDESSRVKQFDNGGFLNTIRGGMQNLATNVGNFASDFGQSFKDPETVGTYGNIISGVLRGPQSTFSGASQVAKGISSVAGKFGLPGKIVGAGVQAIGSIIDRQRQKKMEGYQDQAFANLQEGAFEQGMQSLQNQYSGYMKDGGWVSHDWQPQVIAKFGEYSVKDLLAPPKDADMLRAGGNIRNIRSNYMGDDEKMKMSMAMGGSLKTHWGGEGEVMSYNPYMPGSGETVMLKGNSHEESDGKGRTGIGMSYGGNMVEAERMEPVAEMEEGGDVGNTSAVVFGNMKIPSYGVSELQDPNAKNKKFKSYVADLSKKEAKQNKKVEKAIDQIDNIDGDTPFDRLKMNSAMASLTGADMKLRNIAQKKMTAAGIQSAILDTAEEFGLESDALSKGKVQQAKMGKKVSKAQGGMYIPTMENLISSEERKRIVNEGRKIVERKYNAGEWGTPPNVYTDEDLYKIGKETTTKAPATAPSQPVARPSAKPASRTQAPVAAKPQAPAAKRAAAAAISNYRPAYTPQTLKSDLEAPEFMQPVDFDQSLYIPKGIPQLSDVVKNRYDITGVVPQELSFESDYYNTPEERYAMSKPVGIPSSIAAMVERAATQARQSSSKGAAKEAGKASDNMADYAKMIANEVLQYTRPINQLPLSPEQLMGEQFALATNVLEPVQAQTYQPMLETRAPQMTAQAMLNENQASFNALARQIGNNPAALSVLAAQKQDADRKVIAQVEAANQAQRQAVAARNIGVLNDATLKNLAILDNQYQRQTQARAATKAQAQAALSSIASKIAQNKLENLTSGVMQNMYNYRFGPKGRIINYNPLADFAIPNIANLSDETKKAIAEQAPELAKQLGLSKSSKKEARNGSIVKAIKNL